MSRRGRVSDLDVACIRERPSASYALAHSSSLRPEERVQEGCGEFPASWGSSLSHLWSSRCALSSRTDALLNLQHICNRLVVLLGVSSEIAHKIKEEDRNHKNFHCFFDDPDDKVLQTTTACSLCAVAHLPVAEAWPRPIQQRGTSALTTLQPPE